MKKWYVLKFVPTRFTSVFNFLSSFQLSEHVSFFCPMRTYRYLRNESDRHLSYRERETPVFSGYLFVELDFQEVHPDKLAAFQHIYGLITFCDEPVPVPKKLMNTILKWDWETSSPVLRGRKSIPHRFAEILLMEEPTSRSFALLNYLTDVIPAPDKRLNMEHD